MQVSKLYTLLGEHEMHLVRGVITSQQNDSLCQSYWFYVYEPDVFRRVWGTPGKRTITIDLEDSDNLNGSDDEQVAKSHRKNSSE